MSTEDEYADIWLYKDAHTRKTQRKVFLPEDDTLKPKHAGKYKRCKSKTFLLEL